MAQKQQTGLDQQQVGIIDGLISAATIALFDAYELQLTQTADVTADVIADAKAEHVAGVIGFTSPEMSGSIVISGSATLVRFTAPDTGASLHDWMGELANQLLGRIKNQLLKYDVALDMSVPVVVTGLALRTPNIGNHSVRDYSFESGEGELAIRADIAATPSLDLTKETANASPDMDEGDLMLF